LKDYSTDVLSEARIARHGFFNGDVVRSLTGAYYAGNRSNVVKVWNLMMFQVWWEQYFD